MRVFFITRKFPPTLSGMSTYAFNMCRQMVARSVDLRVAVQYRPDHLGAQGYGDGPPISLPGAEVAGIPQINEIERGDFEADIDVLVATAIDAFARRPFDVVHAQYGYPCGVAAVLAARAVGVPAVVSMQGGDGHWFGTCCDQHAAVLEWLLASSSIVLFPTESFRARVEGRAGSPTQGRVLPGAVDTALFRPNEEKRREWRERLGMKNNALGVLYHGRLDDRKGVRELIEGFAGLDDSVCHRAVLAVAGAGPDADALFALAKECLAPGQYVWLGQLPYEDIPGFLAAGDIFCSPTYQEGFSNTLVEAAACGLPLVTTDTVGVRDVFRHEQNAYLVPVAKASAVTEALDRMLRDSAQRARLASDAQTFVKERYGWSSLVDSILSTYAYALPVSPDCPDPPKKGRTSRCRYRLNPLLL
ncbi:hypothetical protein AQ621_11455 [Marinobacter sp. P4B1]|nr:hypothetical protein AQ621_11455 [Marinobacter sp. P4B1]